MFNLTKHHTLSLSTAVFEEQFEYCTIALIWHKCADGDQAQWHGDTSPGHTRHAAMHHPALARKGVADALWRIAVPGLEELYNPGPSSLSPVSPEQCSCSSPTGSKWRYNYSTKERHCIRQAIHSFASWIKWLHMSLYQWFWVQITL